ncbi:HNH endonuclease [Microbacterium resistens]|uniref:HNH endonuclease n=1 Tax=Microbacterium resistens TaxID=156977 RepID=A0ABY3RTU3_9MICO|nr:HNH endonuclease [Microbacterium resistens]UGS26341.1 HNH endonuclease [Microbacterium resistens]
MGQLLSTRAWRELRAEVAAEYRAKNLPCWMDGQPIDYDAPAGDPEALDVDHAKPRSTHPHLALDRNNLRPAHVRCNRSRGNRAPRPQLGTVTEDW